MGKFIVIEGTDCSGKQTQAELLLARLKTAGKPASIFSFPVYDSPTGKIIAGPYLDKPNYAPTFFPEGAPAVPAKVASLYFSADRLYNLPRLNSLIGRGIVVCDRYVSSNMAHQGGKLKDPKGRAELYDWLDNLEYRLLSLPRPDQTIFLHMPLEYSLKLSRNRSHEAPDAHEFDPDHLRNAEAAYLELAKKYKFTTISCVDKRRILTPYEIAAKVWEAIRV